MSIPTTSSYTTESTTSDGASVSIDTSTGEYVMDESMLIDYGAAGEADDDTYLSQLNSGLRVKDLRGILGMPPQFLPSADPRIDVEEGLGSYTSFGRVYAEKIIKNIPLLLITPGHPAFMSDFTEDQKDTVIESFLGGATAGLTDLVENGSGKYYSLQFAYTEYFGYLNTMLRSAALFLDIADEEIDGKNLGRMNWLYRISGSSGGTDIYGNSGLKRFLGPYAGCIPMYADCGNDINDSFSNSTTQSSLASSINSLSDQARELNFLVGGVASSVGMEVDYLNGDSALSGNIENMQDAVKSLGMGSSNIFSKVISNVMTVLAGGKMVFPEIWSDSSFGRSYSCRMKLIAVSGDKLSVFLNILVPLYHVIALTLPRQTVRSTSGGGTTGSQGYVAPFLIRAYYKGLFNVDMGIITDLSVTKGAEGEWTLDGIPTVAEVSFTIKDMYEGFFMSTDLSSSVLNQVFSNITELDYIANSCGININDQEIARTLKLAINLEAGRITDLVTTGIFGNIAQFFNQKMQNLFGMF